MNTNIILGRHSLVHPARVVWIHKIIACRSQTQYVQANQRVGSYFPSCKISQKVDALNHSDDVFQNNNWARQANLVLIAYASSEGSGEPAHPRSLARTSAAHS